MDTGDQLEALIAVWERIAAVGDSLTDEEWRLPTGCPGWSVQDCVAHLSGLHRELSGEPLAETPLPDLPRLRDQPIAQRMERPVELRRAWTGPQVLAEFREVTAARAAALRALLAGPDGADAPVLTVFRDGVPLRRALPITLFDSWSHEQDIRRATDRPGGLDDDRLVELVLGIARDALGSRLAACGAPAGTTVVLGGDDLAVTVVAGDRGTAPSGDGPLASLAMSRADLVARLTGRRTADGAWLGDVAVAGDTAVGTALAERLALTP